MRPSASTSRRPWAASPRSPSRCTAGRATTSAASRTPARRSAAAWPSPATTPARRAPPTSCAPTSTRPSPSSPARTGSTCTPATPRPAAGGSSATSSRPSTFAGWIDWAKAQRHRARLQPDLLLHPQGGGRLHPGHPRRGHPPLLDRARHRLPHDRRGIRPQLGTPCVTNVWIPDGSKDTPVDRKAPASGWPAVARRDLRRADRPAHNRDAVEGKLFGIGSESYVVGSHEFYLGYAVTPQKLLCLDAGHFHPDRS